MGAGDIGSRREFLTGVAALGMAGLGSRRAAAEPPPETTTIRLVHGPSMCHAPQYVAEALLRAEGFAQVSYAKADRIAVIEKALASGEADINLHFAAPLVLRLEAGDPIVILAGGHVGCFELFGTDRVRAIRDLKGKTVAVLDLNSSQYAFLASMLTYVGLDPGKDVNWVLHPPVEAKRLLAAGKIDAYLGFPPDPQELRARRIGHVVLNSAVDRPWAQYFCCMVTGNRDFVRRHPVAAKRALRAILKAADICALEPERAARVLVDRGYVREAEYARQLMRDLPWGKWRDFNPEDTIRFYALRLHEAGMIRSIPQKILAGGTDWRFLNELKRELKS
jgi:NitT/TauT family transport system substrate-binding protein